MPSFIQIRPESKRDLASHVIGVNGWTSDNRRMDGQPKGRPETGRFPCTIVDRGINIIHAYTSNKNDNINHCDLGV